MQPQQPQQQQQGGYREGMRFAHALAALGSTVPVVLLHYGQGLWAVRPGEIGFLFLIFCVFKALPGGNDLGTLLFAIGWTVLAIFRYREADQAFRNNEPRHAEYWGHSHLWAIVSPFLAELAFLPESWRTKEDQFQSKVEPILVFAAGSAVSLISPGVGMILMASAICYFIHGYRMEAAVKDQLIRARNKVIEAEDMQDALSGKPTAADEGFTVHGLDSTPQDQRSRFADALEQDHIASLMDEPPPVGAQPAAERPKPVA